MSSGHMARDTHRDEGHDSANGSEKTSVDRKNNLFPNQLRNDMRRDKGKSRHTSRLIIVSDLRTTVDHECYFCLSGKEREGIRTS